MLLAQQLMLPAQQLVLLAQQQKILSGTKTFWCRGRDLFLFSFYTRRMSFVDMCFLRKSDLCQGILTYRRHKTGQFLSIRWERCMNEIVSRYRNDDSPYLLPLIHKAGNEWRQYRNAQHLINTQLRAISEMALLEVIVLLLLLKRFPYLRNLWFNTEIEPHFG